MSEHTLAQQHHHQQFYSSSSKNVTIVKESHVHHHQYTASVFAKDTVDFTYECKNLSATANGQSKLMSETTTMRKEWKDENETKSFIKQRIERLYGPGALAQVVFPIKRQKSRTSESEGDKPKTTSKPPEEAKTAVAAKLAEDGEHAMKQSTSSPTLPVLRHLRPEFRAQLPIFSPRKGGDSAAMQKSNTVPTLKDEVKVNGHSKVAEVATTVPVPEIKPTAIAIVNDESGEKNGHYFLNVLDREAKRLLDLADRAEADLETDGLPEEAVGKLRSASGKARLLVSQKMQQFKGLCTNNITQAEGEAFPTTNEDLQGFWDMVMLQVDQVNALFKELETLKANKWQEVKTDVVDSKSNMNGNGIAKPKKLVIRNRQTSAASEEARKQREAQRRQMIEERRRAMRTQNKPKESIEIFVPESS